MKNLILLLVTVVVAGTGYFALQTKSAKITSVQALEKVRNLPEVQNYFKAVPNAKVNLDHEDTPTNSYVIQVYEIKNGHTATFNWFEVDKSSGEIKKQF